MLQWKNLLLYFLSFVILLVLVRYAQSKNASEVCSGIEINIESLPDQNFISPKHVEHILSNNEQEVLTGHSLANIDVELLEQRLYSNPYIKQARVHIDMNGKVKVKIKQRQPVFRVIGEKDSYYIDDEFYKLPLSAHYTARVPLITGNITEKYQENNPNDMLGITEEKKTDIIIPLKNTYRVCSEKLSQFAPLLREILKDPFYKAQITQIHVLSSGECELYTLLGDAKIIFGYPMIDVEQKLLNLKTFYKNALRSYGWQQYRTITVKYPKQIVCEKKVQPN
jgi:cell division protein FtsQ